MPLWRRPHNSGPWAPVAAPAANGPEPPVGVGADARGRRSPRSHPRPVTSDAHRSIRNQQREKDGGVSRSCRKEGTQRTQLDARTVHPMRSSNLVRKGTAAPALCSECRSRAQGRSVFEKHHTLDRQADADLTVTVPGNLHRDLSALQIDWPPEVKEDQGRDPLFIAVAILCATWDWYRGLAPYFQQLIDFLRRLRTTV
jgi:hypothetical protein